MPIQKASEAEPLRSTARVGRTGTRIVASRATLEGVLVVFWERGLMKGWLTLASIQLR